MLKIPLSVVGILLAVKVLQIFLTWLSTMKLRFAREHAHPLEPSDTPPVLLPIFLEAEQALADLGFSFSYPYRVDTVVDGRVTSRYVHVFFHPESNTYADVIPAAAPEGLRSFDTVFVSYYHDGSSLETCDAIAHLMPPNPPSVKILDGYLFDLEAQWALHRDRWQHEAGGAVPARFTLEQAVAWQNDCFEKAWRFRVDTGWAREAEGPGTYRCRALAAWTYARRLLAGMKKRSRAVHRHEGEAAGSVEALVSADVNAFEMTDLQKENQRQGWSVKTATFVVSVLLFSLAFGVMLSWSMVPVLLGVLLFHELGHLLGMTLFGYRDRQILFLPFLGAAAIGEKEDATPMQRVIVYLLGPVPGLVLGSFCVLVSNPLESELLMQIGLFALILNYINLLPIMPLDGGRVVETLFLGRFPRVKFFFSLVSVAIVGLAYLGTGDTVLLVLTIMFGLSLPAQWKGSTLTKELAREIPPGADRKLRLKAIFTKLCGSTFAKHPTASRIQMARTLMAHFALPPANAQTMVVGGISYAAALVAPFLLALGVLICSVGFSAARGTIELMGGGPNWERQLRAASSDDERWSILLVAGVSSRLGGDLELATDYLGRALAVAESFDESDLRYVDTLIGLGRTEVEDAQSRAHFERALTRVEKVYGTEHPKIARILSVMVEDGVPSMPDEEKIARLERALAIWEGDDSERDGGWWAAVHAANRIYQGMGRLEAAVSILRNGLAACADEPEEHEFASPVFAKQLAALYMDEGDHELARDVLTEWISILGTSSNSYAAYEAAILEGMLGWNAVMEDDLDAAYTSFNSAFDHLQAAYGDWEDLAVTELHLTCLDICYIHQHAGRREEADAYVAGFEALVGEKPAIKPMGADYGESEEWLNHKTPDDPDDLLKWWSMRMDAHTEVISWLAEKGM